MKSAPYLIELLLQLADGLGRLSSERRERHVNWLAAQQQADGGFTGREGGSDLYYSAFALRALAVLGALQPPVADRAADYLRRQLHRDASVIDLVSLVLAARQIEFAAGIMVLPENNDGWTQQLHRLLEQLRTSDGGYAKSLEGAAGSTYQTFLTALVYQLLEIPQPEPERAVAFLNSQRREDGGYVEIRAMRRSGINPTAAAVAALRILAQPVDHDDDIVDFVSGLQNDEGGFRANTRIPIADLLSTFTALETLRQLGAVDAFDAIAVTRFAEALEQPDGGFLAAAWDEAVDVEYSFYGLGVLALLAAEA